MRMGIADPDPDDFGRAFGGETSDACHRQKESAELDRAESFPERRFGFAGNLSEETEGEMHLAWVGPADAANVRIEPC